MAAAAFAAVGAIASAIGTVVEGAATARAGRAAAANAEIEARQLDAAGKEELAAGQREGFELDRETAMLQSKQQSLAAGSGAGATDATVLDAMDDVKREGGYRRNMALYGAIQRSRGLKAQAGATRRSGQVALEGSRIAATGTIIGGLGRAASGWGSFNAQFGAGTPAGNPLAQHVPVPRPVRG
jgi:hypothetical protein